MAGFSSRLREKVESTRSSASVGRGASSSSQPKNIRGLTRLATPAVASNATNAAASSSLLSSSSSPPKKGGLLSGRPRSSSSGTGDNNTTNATTTTSNNNEEAPPSSPYRGPTSHNSSALPTSLAGLDGALGGSKIVPGWAATSNSEAENAPSGFLGGIKSTASPKKEAANLNSLNSLNNSNSLRRPNSASMGGRPPNPNVPWALHQPPPSNSSSAPTPAAMNDSSSSAHRNQSPSSSSMRRTRWGDEDDDDDDKNGDPNFPKIGASQLPAVSAGEAARRGETSAGANGPAVGSWKRDQDAGRYESAGNRRDYGMNGGGGGWRDRDRGYDNNSNSNSGFQPAPPVNDRYGSGDRYNDRGGGGGYNDRVGSWRRDDRGGGGGYNNNDHRDQRGGGNYGYADRRYSDRPAGNYGSYDRPRGDYGNDRGMHSDNREGGNRGDYNRGDYGDRDGRFGGGGEYRRSSDQGNHGDGWGKLGESRRSHAHESYGNNGHRGSFGDRDDEMRSRRTEHRGEYGAGRVPSQGRSEFGDDRNRPEANYGGRQEGGQGERVSKRGLVEFGEDGRGRFESRPRGASEGGNVHDGQGTKRSDEHTSASPSKTAPDEASRTRATDGKASAPSEVETKIQQNRSPEHTGLSTYRLSEARFPRSNGIAEKSDRYAPPQRRPASSTPATPMVLLRSSDPVPTSSQPGGAQPTSVWSKNAAPTNNRTDKVSSKSVISSGASRTVNGSNGGKQLGKLEEAGDEKSPRKASPPPNSAWPSDRFEKPAPLPPVAKPPVAAEESAIQKSSVVDTSASPKQENNRPPTPPSVPQPVVQQQSQSQPSTKPPPPVFQSKEDAEQSRKDRAMEQQQNMLREVAERRARKMSIDNGSGKSSNNNKESSDSSAANKGKDNKTVVVEKQKILRQVEEQDEAAPPASSEAECLPVKTKDPPMKWERGKKLSSATNAEEKGRKEPSERSKGRPNPCRKEGHDHDWTDCPDNRKSDAYTSKPKSEYRSSSNTNNNPCKIEGHDHDWNMCPNNPKSEAFVRNNPCKIDGHDHDWNDCPDNPKSENYVKPVRKSKKGSKSSSRNKKDGTAGSSLNVPLSGEELSEKSNGSLLNGGNDSKKRGKELSDNKSNESSSSRNDAKKKAGESTSPENDKGEENNVAVPNNGRKSNGAGAGAGSTTPSLKNKPAKPDHANKQAKPVPSKENTLHPKPFVPAPPPPVSAWVKGPPPVVVPVVVQNVPPPQPIAPPPLPPQSTPSKASETLETGFPSSPPSSIPATNTETLETSSPLMKPSAHPLLGFTNEPSQSEKIEQVQVSPMKQAPLTVNAQKPILPPPEQKSEQMMIPMKISHKKSAPTPILPPPGRLLPELFPGNRALFGEFGGPTSGVYGSWNPPPTLMANSCVDPWQPNPFAPTSGTALPQGMQSS